MKAQPEEQELRDERYVDLFVDALLFQCLIIFGGCCYQGIPNAA